jgi:16S rRNA A1518/A1519 N6-dimethyltransferase RsmA/KsgA/DIM1 with predicted DNA glycosylase/AP lyase activity
MSEEKTKEYLSTIEELYQSTLNINDQDRLTIHYSFIFLGEWAIKKGNTPYNIKTQLIKKTTSILKDIEATTSISQGYALGTLLKIFNEVCFSKDITDNESLVIYVTMYCLGKRLSYKASTYKKFCELFVEEHPEFRR